MTSQLLTGCLPDGTLPGQAQDGLQQSQKRVVKPAVPIVGGTHGIGGVAEPDELLLDAPELDPDDEAPELELDEDFPPELDEEEEDLPASLDPLELPVPPELPLDPELLLEGLLDPEEDPLEFDDPPTMDPELLLLDGGMDASSAPPSVKVESPGELPQATTMAVPTSAMTPMVRRKAK